MGDSNVVIDWIKGISELNVLLLSFWKSRILDLKKSFHIISFGHIYREFNVEDDELSKRAMGPLDDFIFFEEVLEGEIIDSGKLFLFWED